MNSEPEDHTIGGNMRGQTSSATGRSRIIVAAAAMALALVVGAGVAAAQHATKHVRPTAVHGLPPTINPSLATRAAQATTRSGEVASVWSVPSSDGKKCTFAQVDTTATAAFNGNLAGRCASSAADAARPAITSNLVWSRLDDGTYESLVFGVVNSPRAKRITLSTSQGERQADLASGAFVFSLPNTGTSGALAAEALPAVLTIYSASGVPLGQQDLTDILAASPAR